VSHGAPTDPLCRYRRIGVGPYAGWVSQFGHLGALDGDFFGSSGRRRVTVMGRGTSVICGRPMMKTVVEYLPAGNGGGPVDVHGGRDVTDSPPGWRQLS